MNKDLIFLLENRKDIEEFLLNYLQTRFNKETQKYNSSRTIGDLTEIFIRDGFKLYLEEKHNIKIPIKDLLPQGKKSIEDMKYNSLLIDTKSSNSNNPNNMISPFVLLENINKEIIYFFSKYELIEEKVILKRFNIRHYRELDYSGKKELCFTSSIGKGQIQFKKISETYNMKNKEEIKKIIIKKMIEANNRKLKKILEDNEKLLNMN